MPKENDSGRATPAHAWTYSSEAHRTAAATPHWPPPPGQLPLPPATRPGAPVVLLALIATWAWGCTLRVDAQDSASTHTTIADEISQPSQAAGGTGTLPSVDATVSGQLTFGRFTLRNKGSGLSVAPTKAGLEQTNVSPGDANQEWEVFPLSFPYLQLKNTATQRCIDASHANPNGGLMTLTPCGTAAGQQWRLQSAGGAGEFLLVNAESNQCLDVFDQSTQAHAVIDQWSCWGGANQTFTFDRTQPASFRPPLQTRGPYVVDSANHVVKLGSVNWYGASDSLFVAGGLDKQGRTTIAKLVVGMGFNSVRLPYSDQMVRENPTVDKGVVAANPDLAGVPAMVAFEQVVKTLNDQGLGVILNNHITTAVWCCGNDPCDQSWSNEGVAGCRLTQTQDAWIENWEAMARLSLPYPFVVGADLRNEIRSGVAWETWAKAAETAAERIHAINPNLLVIVEGLNYAQDLTGVRARPVRLTRPNKVVYSSHTYAWFTSGDYASSVEAGWGYIAGLGADAAQPLWIGEFGVPGAAASPSDGDKAFLNNATRYAAERHFSFAYWALNPERSPGVAETYGLLSPDWSTPLDDYRTKAMRRLMASP